MMFQAILLLQLLLPGATTPSVPFYGPAFTLSVAPTRPTMPQGGSTEFTVYVNATENVAYTARIEGVPASVRAQIPVLHPGANKIIVSCPRNTPHGAYAIQVHVAAGQNQQTQTFALEIDPLPPAL